ncbi:nuclear transport factor 2 family protein [Streptomyces sp. NBC_01537]|uniref:nuclear transport factor 2 family protein n=1 Tax=Streptomyces sp. NBC_01537 TaxID=2903896 RepID=UPI0038691F63
MTETSAATVIHNHVQAFNARDLDALMSGFTDAALWITGKTAARGRAEIAELFSEAMTGLLPELTVHTLLVQGDQAACQMTETLTVGGRTESFPIAAFYVLHDSRIASAKIYREGSAEIG